MCVCVCVCVCVCARARVCVRACVRERQTHTHTHGRNQTSVVGEAANTGGRDKRQEVARRNSPRDRREKKQVFVDYGRRVYTLPRSVGDRTESTLIGESTVLGSGAKFWHRNELRRHFSHGGNPITTGKRLRKTGAPFSTGASTLAGQVILTEQ